MAVRPPFSAPGCVPWLTKTTPLGKIPLWEEQFHRDPDGGYWIENYKGEKMSIRDFVLPDA